MYTHPQYGQALRNANRPLKYIEICEKSEVENLLKNQYVLRHLCWCYYDAYIKNYSEDDEDSEAYEKFIKAANFIVENCEQLSASQCFMNPYVITTRKVASILGKRDEIELQLEWLDKISVELLPEEANQYEVDGEVRNYESLKQQILNQQCWALYKQKIKSFSDEEAGDKFQEFLKAAEWIVINCKQKEADVHSDNPFVLTVLRVVRAYNRKNHKRYNKILEWITKLDPAKLSDEPYPFTDSEGKEREKASPKEYYFQYLSKAYEKMEEYQKCIEVCDAALEYFRGKKLHYKNHVWFRARREYCNCLLASNFEQAIDEYIKIAEREKHWFMYHKVASLYFRRSFFNEALIYAAKAFVSHKLVPEKMINLIFDMGLFLQATSKLRDAIVFFHACAYHRDFNEWNLSEELKFIIEENGIDYKKASDTSAMLKIAQGYYNVPASETGNIKMIMQNKDGFIKKKDGIDIYFSSRENKDFQVGDEVEFNISKDRQDRPIAINIKKVRKNHGRNTH